MNKYLRHAMVVLLAAPTLSFAAKSDEPSVISAYAGKYSGTVLLTSGSTAISGTASATFQASKKKEAGSLNITSLVISGSTPAVLTQSYSIRKRSLTYLLNLGGIPLSASGSSKVGTKQISYTLFGSSGSTPFTIFGKMTLSKKRLTINETISAGSTTLFFSYSLKKKGGKK